MADLSKMFSSVKNTAVELGGELKVQGLIKAEELKIQEIYHKLGKKYYELYKDSPESSLREFVDKLDECNKKIAEYREQLESPNGDEFREVQKIVNEREK